MKYFKNELSQSVHILTDGWTELVMEYLAACVHR